MEWIDINDKKPQKSGVYKVKLSMEILHIDIKEAYYEVLTDCWTYDDGFWLPFSITGSVTHWKEIK